MSETDMPTLNDTPQANRLHIALYGRTNSGKSSLLNRLTGQDSSLVSPVSGTTTDPVYKAMELSEIGPCLFIDTAGFDDESELGSLRVEQTKRTLKKADVALLLVDAQPLAELGHLLHTKEVVKYTLQAELQWMADLQEFNTPMILLVSKSDLLSTHEKDALMPILAQYFGVQPLYVSIDDPDTTDEVRQALLRAMPADFEKSSITGTLAKSGDLILLVMPQDIQAPKGRLILPQVQTLRDLLDKKCVTVSCTADTFETALSSLVRPPELIITDSQLFRTVYEKKPASSKLTSFSILFANFKGDLPYYVSSASAIDSLTAQSRILIAEACTHAPLTEDIGTEKIPKLLRQKVGENLSIDFVRGIDFPEDLSSYDLIIQCGACMFNRRYVLSRIARAKAQHIPMTNYGVAIAHLSGVLEYVDF